jgi:PAS domain S-box-containing protein
MGCYRLRRKAAHGVKQQQGIDAGPGEPDLACGDARPEATGRNQPVGLSDRGCRTLFDTARDPIVILDPGTRRVVDANRAFADLLEQSLENIRGLHLRELGMSENREQFQRLVEAVKGLLPFVIEEMPLTTRRGTHRNIELATSTFEEKGRRLIQWRMRDVTGPHEAARSFQQVQQLLEQAVAERTAELSAANAALALEMGERRRAQQAHLEAVRRLVDAQETERSRFSRELHDQLGQELTALKLGLKVVRSQDALFTRAVNQCVERLEGHVDNLMRGVHRLAWELRPVVLDDFGLELALRRYVRDWSELSGVPVDFHSQGIQEKRLPPPFETTLYRVTQEALTNIYRHARASRVSVLLERRGQQVSLIVEDNGQGFAVEEISRAGPATRMGLIGMRDRVTLVGGNIQIQSSPGTGSTLFVRIPLPAATT